MPVFIYLQPDRSSPASRTLRRFARDELIDSFAGNVQQTPEQAVRR